MEAYLIVAMLKNDVANVDMKSNKEQSRVSVIEEETESQRNYQSKSSDVHPISSHYDDDTEQEDMENAHLRSQQSLP